MLDIFAEPLSCFGSKHSVEYARKVFDRLSSAEAGGRDIAETLRDMGAKITEGIF